MKKNKKVFLTILFLMVMLMAMLTCNNSYAVLQVNGGEPTTQTLANWMTNFRKMEGLGGTLGLEETLNTNLTGTTSNNLDCHMIKNTEYGALTILSASSYGNPYRIEDGDTTTGNKTGAYMKINGERVAAACSDLDPSTWKNANPRYKNIYTTSYQRKIGDSVDIGSWHGGNNLSWFYVDTMAAWIIMRRQGELLWCAVTAVVYFHILVLQGGHIAEEITE